MTATGGLGPPAEPAPYPTPEQLAAIEDGYVPTEDDDPVPDETVARRMVARTRRGRGALG